VNIQHLRSDTPGCAERIHLNNAGSALMPAPVIRTIEDYIELESRIGGYEAADARAEAMQSAYRAVADLVGADIRNIAFTENATASYVQALSSIPFERDDVILTTRHDYSSNQIQFLSLQQRLGIRVLRAPDAPDGGVDVPAMAALVARHRPRLVSVTHIPTNSGLVQDVAAIGRVCRDAGVWYLVDACQSVGQMPVNAVEIGCDFLSATSRKYLRGPRGAGFLYVSDRALNDGLEPLFIDMHGAEWVAEDRYQPLPDAKRFETFEFAWALVLATGEAARYAQAIGLDAIRDRIYGLADRLRRALAQVDGVRVLDRGPTLCGIVSIAIDGRDSREVMLALRAQGINTSAQRRAHAIFDYDSKGVTSTLRLSPHCYNTQEEIDRAVAAIEEGLRASA
jgi:selenocysteine lyase/cysteine desulfurase